MGFYGRFPEYVSVADKKIRNAKMAEKLKKKNKDLKPIVIRGKKITNTFWGKAWCDNVEAYQDYENRLPRGRSYVKSGAVIDLQISKGLVTALVAGSDSSPYKIRIEIAPLDKTRWEALKKKCVGKISSLLALAQGKLPTDILAEFCDKKSGLFPSPKEIKTTCDCPDWADLCKHLAAVFYGVGARLDEDPKLFFVLRGIDENELVGADVIDSLTEGATSEIADDSLTDVFGVEFYTIEKPEPPKVPKVKEKTRKTAVPRTWTSAGIRHLRMRLGISQASFAKLCGASITTVNLWENKKTRITERFWQRLDELSDSAVK